MAKDINVFRSSVLRGVVFYRMCNMFLTYFNHVYVIKYGVNIICHTQYNFSLTSGACYNY